MNIPIFFHQQYKKPIYFTDTYTFICIQWKVDVWYSIKWNTEMLKRTEFSSVRSLGVHIHENKKAESSSKHKLLALDV